MEDCRSIYLEACAEVARAFRSDRFRYPKSRREMVRKEPDLVFRVAFQSDPRNWLVDHPIDHLAPHTDDLKFFAPIDAIEREMAVYGSVILYVWLTVGSARLQTWRKSLPQPVRTSDAITGVPLSDLVGTGRQWMVVNLANPRTRGERIEAIAGRIRNHALPYFERFRDPGKIVADVIETSVPGMGVRESIDYAFFHCGREAAISILTRHMKSFPDLWDGYKKTVEDFRQHGMPAPNTVFGNVEPQLTFIALALGLEPIE